MTEPLAVYDVTTDEGREFLGTPAHMQLLDWMAGEGLDPGPIVRIEIHGGGQPYARITEKLLYRRGVAVLNEEGTGVRLRDPHDVQITSLPPGARR